MLSNDIISRDRSYCASRDQPQLSGERFRMDFNEVTKYYILGRMIKEVFGELKEVKNWSRNM